MPYCWFSRGTAHVIVYAIVLWLNSYNNCNAPLLFPTYEQSSADDSENNMINPARTPTLWTLRKASIRISRCMPRGLTRTYTFRFLCFFCTLYLYTPETECVGPDQSARTVQADLDRYITQNPPCWFSRGTAYIYITIMIIE